MWQFVKSILSDPRVQSALIGAALVLVRVCLPLRNRDTPQRGPPSGRPDR